jgi:S-adenosylmethionine:tRNA-ribosyltransferase-isomerase (queuine synthetase)
VLRFEIKGIKFAVTLHVGLGTFKCSRSRELLTMDSEELKIT